MSTDGVPLIDVLARWGYSELIGSIASRAYDNRRGVSELRAVRTNGIPFDQLSMAERDILADLCRAVRTSLQGHLSGIELFDIAEVSHDALADFLVPGEVSRLPMRAIVRFADYMAMATDDPNDARNVELRHPTYEAHADPVTVGRSGREPILIDGYHRAALFWKFGPAGGKLLAYMPR